MQVSRIDILSRPLFILALITLLLNDFYLKYEYSSFLTGKLSDVAGLFLFPIFLSSLRIKWSKAIYIGSALLFIFWKSPLSQGIIDWCQTMGIGFNRVIDYTDLLALFILPLSYIFFQKQLSNKRRISKYLSVPIAALCLFAIWATSLQREKVEINLDMDEVYELPISKSAVFNSMQAAHGYSDTLQENLKDSLFYLHFDIQDDYRANVTASTIITATSRSRTKIKLDSILHIFITGSLFTGVSKDEKEYFKSFSANEFKKHFETKVIKPLKNGKAEMVFYDNKEIHDSYQNK